MNATASLVAGLLVVWRVKVVPGHFPAGQFNNFAAFIRGESFRARKNFRYKTLRGIKRFGKFRLRDPVFFHPFAQRQDMSSFLEIALYRLARYGQAENIASCNLTKYRYGL